MNAETILTEFALSGKQSKRRFNHQGPLRWIISHITAYWILICLVILGAFGNAGLNAFVPLLIGQAFNAVLLDPEINTIGRTLLWLALGIGASQVVRAGLQFARNYGAELLAQRVERDIRDELYTSLLGKSMTFHSLQSVGETMARATNDVREVNFMFSPGLNLVIGSAMFLIMPIVLAPRYHPTLIIIPLIYFLLYWIALWHYLHELNPVTRDSRHAFGEMNARLSEALDGIETVKGAAQEVNEIAIFKDKTLQVRNAIVRQGNIEARFLPMLLLVATSASGFLHASLLLYQGIISVGDVVAYFTLLQMFGFPTFASLFAYSQVSLGIAGARRILALIKQETKLDQNTEGFSTPIRGAVEFRGVSFAYPESTDESLENKDEPALKDISFRVEPGQTVAIVGQTGSGKTTLVKLINRTYDTTKGQVLVDDVDVRDWNLETLRRGISIIEQDVFLFSRSIAENIAFGRPDANQSEIEAAAASAQAEPFIHELKDGYQTVIGERGVTLSGGQRQRLALARAFLTDPRILILDDSTSSIDSETEDRIQRAIYSAARGRTTFLITHRLSQIRWADLILVIRKGQLVTVGKHEDLLSTSWAYQRIFNE